MLRWTYVVACLALLSSVSKAQDKLSGQYFVSSEIIVKFSGSGKGAELAARALTEGNPSDARLGSYVKTISSEVGVPLEVKRFGSGGNVILAIRLAELAENLSKRFRDIPDVEDAHMVSEKNVSISAIEISFKQNCREAEILAQPAQEGAESRVELEAITKKLEQDGGVPLTARVVSPRHLLVTLDLQKLTVDLATRLKKRSDVEYAQPNFVRRLTNGNSGVQSPQ
jgi:hypothetical protein